LAVLFIDILHNGAVAFHVHGSLGRILSNIFIWAILVVGGFVIVFFRDWYSHLKDVLIEGYLDLQSHIIPCLLQLNNCQSKLSHCNGSLVLPTKVPRLTVAFVISGVLALLSIFVIVPQMRHVVDDVAGEGQARVDSGVDETSRLLSGGNA
jgi:hypothetical protein